MAYDVACRYDEARLAYSRSGKPYMAARILEDLCATATKQQNFKDAAYLCYQMAHVVLQVLFSCLWLRHTALPGTPNRPSPPKTLTRTIATGL